MTLPIFAHRGASLHAFENTQRAFDLAVAAGADGIELDVQLTKDGYAVIFHDIDLVRLTGKKGRITDVTYETLKHWKVGKRFRRFLFGEPILTLADAITWAHTNNIPLNIELKESFQQQPIAIAQLFKHIVLPKGSHVSSFHPDVLSYVKHVRPDIETAYIVKKKFQWAHIVYYPFVDVIHAHKRLYKQANLQACQEVNKHCRFYGVTGEEAFLKAPHEAVIGWIADDVAAIRRAQ